MLRQAMVYAPEPPLPPNRSYGRFGDPDDVANEDLSQEAFLDIAFRSMDRENGEDDENRTPEATVGPETPLLVAAWPAGRAVGAAGRGVGAAGDAAAPGGGNFRWEP